MLQCWNFDPSLRPAVSDLIQLLRNNPTLIQPCLDAPSSAIALEGTASLEMSLAPRPRAVRGSHARRPSGDVWSQRRGLSTSSSHGGCGQGVGDDDSKISTGEYSPDAGLASLIDPFGLTTPNGGIQSPQQPIEMMPRYYRTTSGAPAVPLLHGHGGGSRVSFDSFVRNAVFGRSLSTDPDRRTSAVVVTLGRGGGCGETTTDSTTNCRSSPAVALPIPTGGDTNGSGSVVCSTESLHVGSGGGLDAVVDNCCRRAPTSSLESRTDSDYCSQHSKDFPLTTTSVGGVGGRCAPFV